ERRLFCSRRRLPGGDAPARAGGGGPRGEAAPRHTPRGAPRPRGTATGGALIAARPDPSGCHRRRARFARSCGRLVGRRGAMSAGSPAQEPAAPQRLVYETPWPAYALAWSADPRPGVRLAVGSCLEQDSNKIHVVEQAEDRTGALELKAAVDHPLAPTKLMWRPSCAETGKGDDLLVSASTIGCPALEAPGGQAGAGGEAREHALVAGEPRHGARDRLRLEHRKHREDRLFLG
ncbi:unnamed protein product, partial [Prorocentrum cordatum]